MMASLLFYALSEALDQKKQSTALTSAKRYFEGNKEGVSK